MPCYVSAEDICPGAVLEDGRHVIDISCNSGGAIILRCAYSEWGYPATSLLCAPSDKIGILSNARKAS